MPSREPTTEVCLHSLTVVCVHVSVGSCTHTHTLCACLAGVCRLLVQTKRLFVSRF